MDRQKLPWVIGLLLIGLTALAVSFWMNRSQEIARRSSFQVAQVEHITGNIWILSPGFEKKRKVVRTGSISAQESLETEDTGEARLTFENGANVRVQPDSLILLERNDMTDGFQDVLILQRGDIRIEDAGRPNEFFISKNGERVAAKDYHAMPLSKEPLEKPVFVETGLSAQSGLSDDEITSIVTAQRSNFMKCFTTLLQKKPESKGDLSLNFTIENTGKVGLIDVQSVQLKDDEFRKCLSNVLSRVQFRAYTGTPISTFFPLKFE